MKCKIYTEQITVAVRISGRSWISFRSRCYGSFELNNAEGRRSVSPPQDDSLKWNLGYGKGLGKRKKGRKVGAEYYQGKDNRKLSEILHQ